MSYLRLLRQSDLRTIQNSYVELFQLSAPSRWALEEALASSRWLCLAAVSPDSSSPSRQEYMGGFVMSVVASVADFNSDMNYYGSEPAGAGGFGGGGGGGGGVGVQATGLEAVGLPSEEQAVNICLLGVLPSYRRRGLARLLLRQVVDSGRTASACAVFLHVRPSNIAALALYRAAGFVAAALVPDYYDAGEATDGTSDRASATTTTTTTTTAAASAPHAAAAVGNGNGSKATDPAAEAAVGPTTAGGDAVLLVLPLTEAASAAVAAAAAVAAPAVSAAVLAAWPAAPPRPPGAASASGSSRTESRPVGGPDITGRTGSRFVGRGAAVDAAVDGDATSGPQPAATVTSASDTSTRASTGTGGASSGASSQAEGGGGGSGGLLGVLAAAAVGAVGGLSSLLPGRAGRGGGGAEQPVARQVRVGDEVLVESSGPDGEVYLRGADLEAEGGVGRREEAETVAEVWRGVRGPAGDGRLGVQQGASSATGAGDDEGPGPAASEAEVAAASVDAPETAAVARGLRGHSPGPAGPVCAFNGHPAHASALSSGLYLGASAPPVLVSASLFGSACRGGTSRVGLYGPSRGSVSRGVTSDYGSSLCSARCRATAVQTAAAARGAEPIVSAASSVNMVSRIGGGEEPTWRRPGSAWGQTAGLRPLAPLWSRARGPVARAHLRAVVL